MRTDEELLGVYVETRESTDDFVEAQLLKNIQSGNQRAIEFYLTNRRSAKWRLRGVLSEQDGSESGEVEKLFDDVLKDDSPAAGDSGENAGLPRPNPEAWPMDKRLLGRPDA